MNEVLKTIKERSSIRAYTDEKLTREEINAVITAALQAPTARNMQEVHVSVVGGDNPILKEIDTDRKIKMLASAPDKETTAGTERRMTAPIHAHTFLTMFSLDSPFCLINLFFRIIAHPRTEYNKIFLSNLCNFS